LVKRHPLPHRKRAGEKERREGEKERRKEREAIAGEAKKGG